MIELEQAALTAFIVHINRAYTGDPKDHRDWPAYLAGYLAGNHVADVRHMVGVPDGLIAALRNQRQIDRDGSEVSVSRQAVDEAADLLDSFTTPPADSPDIITHFGAINEPENEQNLEHPIGWKISYTDAEGVRQSVLCAHNSVGDYRGIDPLASSIALGPFMQPSVQQDANKVDAQPSSSPTAGMSLGERIAHVGGRTNDQGYIEFGSPMAVNALIQHVLRDIAPIEAQPNPAMAGDDLAQHFQGMSDQAYIRYIDQLKQNVCRGVEYKLENNKFGVTELAAHNKACEFLGRHRAFSEAAKLLKRVQPASGEDAKRYRRALERVANWGQPFTEGDVKARNSKGCAAEALHGGYHEAIAAAMQQERQS